MSAPQAASEAAKSHVRGPSERAAQRPLPPRQPFRAPAVAPERAHVVVV